MKKEEEKEYTFEGEEMDNGLEVFEGFFNAIGIMIIGAFLVWLGWYGINRQMKINKDLHKLEVQLSNERPTVDVR